MSTRKAIQYREDIALDVTLIQLIKLALSFSGSQGFDRTTEISVGSSRLIESTFAFNKVVAYALL